MGLSNTLLSSFQTSFQKFCGMFFIFGILSLFPTPSFAGWYTYGGGPIASNPSTAAQLACQNLTLHFDPSTLRPNSNDGRVVNYSFCCRPSASPSSGPCNSLGTGSRGTVGPAGCASNERGDASAISGCIARSEPKQNGPQCPAAGNPFTIATGNKFQQVTDYTTQSSDPLSFVRTFNNLEDFTNLAGSPEAPVRPNMLGLNWRSNWDRSIAIYTPHLDFFISRRWSGIRV